MKRLLTIIFYSSALLFVPGAHAVSLEDVRKATREGEYKINLRYRFESVDQDGSDEEANASTLRSRFTWTSGKMDKWTYGIEADYVALIGAEDYNSTENGRTAFPVVADPEGFDLNQAFIKYGGDNITATLGRQRIVQADQRFVGGVAWRQNEQTYDAVRAQYTVNEQVTLDYSYVWNVNRIFGPNDGAQPADWRSNSHFLNVAFKPAKGHKLEGFAYLLDFENDNGLPNSTATYGVSYSGQLGPLKVAGTYAQQSDYADSPLNYDADFLSLSAGLKLDPVTLSVGYDVLGSDDGAAGFRTPLATLHKFQGWADKFLGTPANGIEDTYFGVAGAVGPVKLSATYHEYEAEEGGATYGDELNLVANYSPTKGINLQLKLADYSADEFATDTQKLWFSIILNI
ncbi:MAG: porin [Pseudomonadota bacterium]